MGFIRSVLLIFVSLLIFISFLTLGAFATLNSSLNHDNVKFHLKSPIEKIVREEVDLSSINNTENILKNQCNSNSSSEYIYKGKNTERTFVIPCSIIAQGREAVIEHEINFLIDEVYYKEYNCEFWKCLEENSDVGPLFLVSKPAKDYWKSNYRTMLLVSVLLTFLIFLLVKNKKNFPIHVGVLLVVSFIPISKLDSIGKIISKILFSSLENAPNGLSSIDLNIVIPIIFSKADNVFLIGFIIGLILIALGIFLKSLAFGLKIGEFISKLSSKKESQIKPARVDKAIKKRK